MRKRPLKLEHALDVLPELPEMEAFREALLQSSQTDDTLAWAGSQAYLTLDKRLADVSALRRRVPELAEEARRRTERLYGHSADALAAAEAGDLAGAARALVAAGELEEAALRYDAAERFYHKALELGRKPRDRRAEGLALRRLGRLERARGRLERAQQLYREGYEVARLQRDDSGATIGCMGVGNVLGDQGRWEEAREWFQRALEHLPERTAPEFLHLCNALSVVERRLGNLEQSEAWIRQGEEVAEAVPDASALGYLEHGRARLHLARGEVQQAETTLRRMLDRPIDPSARISALVYLAEPLLAQGRADEAERAVRSAEGLALRTGVVRYLPLVYRTLGDLARRRGDEEGFVFFEQALEVIRGHDLPVFELASTQHEYGRFQAQLGELDAARERLRLARDAFRAIGAEIEAEEVESTLQRIEPPVPDVAEGEIDGGR